MPSRSPSLTAGRLGAFTLLGAAAGSVPLPWVPAALARRVRGALVQDIVAHHGLSLSPEARTAFEEPNRRERSKSVAREAMRFLTTRVLGRLGPMSMFPPVRTGLDTFVLGHLLSRYLGSRQEASIRIYEEEAIAVRRIIDRALTHALTAGIEGLPEPVEVPPEDLRDEVTQAVDGVLIATATVPSWLVRRLEAAFDDMLARR
jgi:hypothetical protein